MEMNQDTSQIYKYINEKIQSIMQLCIRICEQKMKLFQAQQNEFDNPKEFLSNLQQTLKKIFNKMLSSKHSLINFGQQNFQQLIQQQPQDQYNKIQDLLQKQQQKNRNHLKKQFQSKQIFNNLLNDINELKDQNNKQNTRINKLNEQLQEKTIQIMHLRNQIKILERDSNKSKFNQLMKTQKKKQSKQLFSQSFDLQKGNLTSRERASSRMNYKQSKQDALYAIYTSQKKKNYETLNPTKSQNLKKYSLTSKNCQKKVLSKNITSVFTSEKRTHQRKKSEDLYKKGSSKKDRKNDEQNIKKKKKQFNGFMQALL